MRLTGTGQEFPARDHAGWGKMFTTADAGTAAFGKFVDCAIRWNYQSA
jgi:hypothetical protein